MADSAPTDRPGTESNANRAFSRPIDWAIGGIVGVVGALVGSLPSFVPLSPLLGGVAAGYLDPDPDASGLGAGALANVFGCLPLLLVVVFANPGCAACFRSECGPRRRRPGA